MARPAVGASASEQEQMNNLAKYGSSRRRSRSVGSLLNCCQHEVIGDGIISGNYWSLLFQLQLKKITSSSSSLADLY